MFVGEVWSGYFPLEEDKTKFLPRPIAILEINEDEILSVKITKTDPRETDDYDTSILYWQHAKLRIKSTARISKTTTLDKSQFIHKIGDLHSVDLTNLQNKYMAFVTNIEI